MSLAYQQQQDRRRQQQVVYHEPGVQQATARSVTQQPDFDEVYDASGNSGRAALVGLDGGGGQGVAPALPPDANMAAYRDLVDEQAAEDTLAIQPFEIGIAFQSTEEGLMATSEACVDRMARFEDASHRWYHFGCGQEQYEQERPRYEFDIRMYQQLALRARQDGALVEGALQLADEALRESDATRLMFEDRDLGASKPGEPFALDAGRFGADLAEVEEAFATTGLRPCEEAVQDDLVRGAAGLFMELGVREHDLGFALSTMRAEAQARRAGAVEAEIRKIDEIVSTCDRLGELLRVATAAVSLGRCATDREDLGERGAALADVLDPFQLPGLVAEAVYADDLRMLAGRLAALGRAEDGWRRIGVSERIQGAMEGYRGAWTALHHYGQSRRGKSDDYVGRLGNIGRDMDTAALARGLPGARERSTGQAMENLARVRSTWLVLEAVAAPLEVAMARVAYSKETIGEFSRGRTGQAWLDELRREQRGPAEFYASVHRGLAATVQQVSSRRSELAEVSERFGALLSRNRA